MSPEAQRIAIGVHMGRASGVYWCDRCRGNVPIEEVSSGGYHMPRLGCAGNVTANLPDYCNDLNAIHEAEKRIQDFAHYARWLKWVSLGLYQIPPSKKWRVVHCTAAQRAEAFLKTIGKWTALFFLCLSCHGADLLTRIAIIESGNNPMARGDKGQAVGAWQLHREAWSDVSNSRSRRHLSTWPYSYATNAQISRVYAGEYLEILARNFTTANRRKPSEQELYACYNIGFARFSRRSFSLKTVPSTTRKALAKL